MKSLLYISLLFLLSPFTGLSQNDKISYDGQLDLDVQLLGVDIIYKHKILQNLYLGGGGGVGAISSFGGNGIYYEVLRAKLFIGYQFTEKSHFYFGIKYSPIVIDTGNDEEGPIRGVEIGFFKKLKKIEIGLEFTFGHFDFRESTSQKIITASFLIIKIPLISY